MLDFYIPKTTKDLITMLKKFYPDGKFSGMPKKQLLGIYIQTRRRGMVIK